MKISFEKYHLLFHLFPSSFRSRLSLFCLPFQHNSFHLLAYHPNILCANSLLQNNSLSAIPPTLLSSATQLTELDISGNMITSVDDGFFLQAIKLTTLSIGNNMLTAIPDVDYLWQLQSFYCDANLLSDSLTLDLNSSHLVVLSLADNQLTSITLNLHYEANQLSLYVNNNLHLVNLQVSNDVPTLDISQTALPFLLNGPGRFCRTLGFHLLRAQSMLDSSWTDRTIEVLQACLVTHPVHYLDVSGEGLNLNDVVQTLDKWYTLEDKTAANLYFARDEQALLNPYPAVQLPTLFLGRLSKVQCNTRVSSKNTFTQSNEHGQTWISGYGGVTLAARFECDCIAGYESQNGVCQYPRRLRFAQTPGGLALITIMCLLGGLFAGFVVFLIRRRMKRQRQKAVEEARAQGRDEMRNVLKKSWDISVEDLQYDKEIGKGGGGEVFRAYLKVADVGTVAVKHLLDPEKHLCDPDELAVALNQEAEFLLTVSSVRPPPPFFPPMHRPVCKLGCSFVCVLARDRASKHPLFVFFCFHFILGLSVQVRHPNIVWFFGAGKDTNNYPFIVLEYAERGSLAHILFGNGKEDAELNLQERYERAYNRVNLYPNKREIVLGIAKTWPTFTASSPARCIVTSSWRTFSSPVGGGPK